MALTLTRHPKGPFGLIDRIHDLQSVLAKAWGRPTNAMLSDLQRDGKPVIFLHNPKTGGKSLRQFLHVVRASHSFASDRLSEKHWLNTFSVVGVRAGEYSRRFPERGTAIRDAVAELVASGQVRPRVDRILPLSQWREAFTAMANRELVGKVVLLPGS